jgi:tRNA (guanine-N7-)-methyltransferase
MTARRPDLDVSPYTLSFPEGPLSWAEVFGNDHPVELEVGSGKGLFLANAASAQPGRNFVGVELARKYARAAAERVAKRRLSNVRVIPGDARRLLAEFIPEASLEAVHIYFPDPWWKQRHRKRRVFCEPFVVDVARVLAPGGRFLIATDVAEYFDVMRRIMAAHPEFIPEPPPPPSEPRHDLDYLTNFERKYRLEGRSIHRDGYRRHAGQGPSTTDP